MRNQGQIFVGVAAILFGLLLGVGNLLDINVGILCLPMGLILLGVWILLRPWLAGPETELAVHIFGPIRRDGVWQVTDQEYWLFVGDVILDFAQAEVPVGETVIRLFGFVGTTRLYVPEGVGVAVSSTAMVTDAKVLGQRRERFVSLTCLDSQDYEMAERKIRLEVTAFVADIRVKQL
jgi:hypothetical protein